MSVVAGALDMLSGNRITETKPSVPLVAVKAEPSALRTLLQTCSPAAQVVRIGSRSEKSDDPPKVCGTQRPLSSQACVVVLAQGTVELQAAPGAAVASAELQNGLGLRAALT